MVAVTLRIVSARRGASWAILGIRTFRNQPLALSALFFAAVAAMALVNMIPLAGPAFTLALLPWVTRAMMLATAQVAQAQPPLSRSALQQRTPTPAAAKRLPIAALLQSALRSGRERLPEMLALGALYALGVLGVTALTAALDGGRFAQVYFGWAALTQELAADPDFQNATALALLLHLPLSLLFWHAPGLLHWYGVPPVKALFFSIVACARNGGAFIVFGLCWLGVFLLGALLLGVALALLAFAGLPRPIATGLMAGSATLLTAMLFTSVFFSFHACFQPGEGAEPPAPALR